MRLVIATPHVLTVRKQTLSGTFVASMHHSLHVYIIVVGDDMHIWMHKTRNHIWSFL